MSTKKHANIAATKSQICIHEMQLFVTIIFNAN